MVTVGELDSEALDPESILKQVQHRIQDDKKAFVSILELIVKV
jgi:hypothetical protein